MSSGKAEPTAVAIYARISLDRKDGAGVARQLADCRALADARWPHARVVEYVDNSISAYRGKRRPEYERLVADVRAGSLGAVVALHPDRLHRRPIELEDFIDAIESVGAAVATVQGGTYDLSTASGRMTARILGSVARHESEHMGERISRAKKELAAKGRHPGGGNRPFGLTADRTALVQLEAEAIRQVAANVIAGASWYGEEDRLNNAGILTTRGSLWTHGTLRRALTSPYVVGLKAYRGTVIGDAVWPAILDKETWLELRDAAQSRKRGGRQPSGRWLLSGLLVCHGCGNPMYANTARGRTPKYECRVNLVSNGRKGCGGTSISIRKVDDYVRATVRGWLQRPGMVAAIDAWFAGYDDTDAGDELAAIDQQLTKARQWWTAGDLPDDEFQATLADLRARRAAVEDRRTRTLRPAVPVTAESLAEDIDDATIAELRPIIATLARTPIVVGPGLTADRHAVPVEQRVDVRPAWEE